MCVQDYLNHLFCEINDLLYVITFQNLIVSIEQQKKNIKSTSQALICLLELNNNMHLLFITCPLTIILLVES